MSRAVVVDGHNAIHALRMRDGTIHDLRARLVDRVRFVCPRGATVHFDGHPPAGEFGGTEIRGVTVRFSGRREADDEIFEHVHASHHPRRFLVVTDDMGLARRVEQIGARTVRVAEFLPREEPREETRETRRPRGRPRVPVVPVSDDRGAGAPGRDDPAQLPDAAGMRPSDFGLPETIDVDAPPGDLAPVRPSPRTPRRAPKRPADGGEPSSPRRSAPPRR